MNLTETCQIVAAHCGLDPDALLAYAVEDPHLGYPDLQAGSIWAPEGQLLYALVRATGAKRVLEIGTWLGVSATHLAEAVKSTGGQVISVDAWPGRGALIPEDLRPYVTLEVADGEQYLAAAPAFDLVFEDTDHTYETTLRITRAAIANLPSGGLLANHDARHAIVGDDVRRAVEDAGAKPVYVRPEPSDCGLAVWRKP